MRRLGVHGVIVVAVTALAIAVPAPRPALAHGLLVSSVPANGASVKSPVESVSLAFTEKPAPYAFFSVTAPSGARVDEQWTNAEPFRLEKPVTEYQQVDGQWLPREYHAGFPVRVPVKHWPEQGAYIVSYHSVASDGDVVIGNVRFTYEGAVTAAPPGWSAPTAGPSAELLAAGKAHGSAAPVAAAAAPASEDKGPWPWLVPVLLFVAVAGAIALAMTGPAGRSLRRRRP
ncbi:MAG: copper resistance protein CopC [Actinoplanes sp.]